MTIILSSVCLSRDFAYVARDKDTRILKCHVFRCDTPAKAIATSLHEICSRVNILPQLQPPALLSPPIPLLSLLLYVYSPLMRSTLLLPLSNPTHPYSHDLLSVCKHCNYTVKSNLTLTGNV